MRLSLPVLLAALVSAPAAQAQPKPPEWAWHQLDLRRVAGLSLVWTQQPGAGQCGSEQSFRGELTDRLGYSPFGSPSPDHPTIVLALRRLDISITRTKSHVTATVSGFDANSEPLFDPRKATHPRRVCEQLRGLVVAMAMDAIRSFIPPLPQADPPAPVKPPAVEPNTTSPSRQDAPGEDPRFGLGMTMGWDLGTGPNPMVGLSYQAILRWPDFSLALEAQLFSVLEGVGEYDMRAHSFAGVLAPCAHRGIVFGCGLAALGVRGFERGYNESRDPVDPDVRNPIFAAIGLRVGVAKSDPNLTVRVLVDLLHAPLPTTLIVRGKEIWSSSPICARLFLGMEHYF